MSAEQTWNTMRRHMLRFDGSDPGAPHDGHGPVTRSLLGREVQVWVGEGQVRFKAVGESYWTRWRTVQVPKRYGKMNMDDLYQAITSLGIEDAQARRRREEAQRVATEAKALAERLAKATKSYQERLNRTLAPAGAQHGYRKVDPLLVPEGRIPMRVTFEENLTLDQLKALYRAWEEVLTRPGRTGHPKPRTAHQHIDEEE